LAFTDVDEAAVYCLSCDVGVGIFVIDVYLGGQSGFDFLETIKGKFPVAHEDAIIITGNASADVVDRCIQADVTYLLEKPMRTYALQLSVRAIAMKYIKFAKRLLQDPVFAKNVSHFE
jgi:DNA-binding NarL/FixJ family response regulator